MHPAAAAPRLDMRPLDENEYPCEIVALPWMNRTAKTTAFLTSDDGDVAVGHRLKVSEWTDDGIPCWAAADTVVAKLASSHPSNVLQVYGWATDGDSTTTAFVVTEMPPLEGLSVALKRLSPTQHVTSHCLTLQLLGSIVEGLRELWKVGLTIGNLNPSTVFIGSAERNSARATVGSPISMDFTASNAVAVLDPMYSIVDSAPTNANTCLETGYTAPELRRTLSSSPTQESDLYAFGALAWAIINFSLRDGLPQIPDGSESDFPVDLSLVPSAVLAGVVAACTAEDPRRRNLGGLVQLLNSGRHGHLASNTERCLTSQGAEVQLKNLMGRGTFGNVHYGDWSGSEVAVKVISGENFGTSHIDACRELSLTMSVAHPNIAEMYGWVEKEKEVWFVMKHYPQGNLEDRLKTRYEEGKLQLQPPSEGGPFGWQVFFRISRGIARALAYLAARNLVHRDLKPSNILMDYDEPVLADFGQGRRLIESAQPAFASRRVGTDRYAAPELVSPGLYPLTPNADVYSFAVLMKHLLIWRPKAVGKTVPFTPPDALAALIVKCTKSDPKDRPQALEVLAELQHLEKQFVTAVNSERSKGAVTTTSV